MKEWIVNLIETGGYWGLALLMFLENVFPPIPSELIMPLGGFTAAQGKLSLPLVILAGTIGSVLGQLPLYYLGHFLGRQRLMRLADKYGKWLAVSGEDIETSSAWFARHGSVAVLLCRLVPGVRSFISIPAGICGMNLPKFLLYSALGMGIWAGVLAYLGHLLGANYEKVERFVGPVSYVVLGVIVIGCIVWIVRRKRAKRRQPPSTGRSSGETAATATTDQGCAS
ncbi:MAG TPA: DedA family protein [Tepidisphaeraceae bacterium]|nr:DedA family protein [Tepidisphaeraceae bacterium]